MLTTKTPVDPKETGRTRSRYDRAARLYDALYTPGERLMLRKHRRELWRRVPGGKILEVGVGTGENVRYYPPNARVTAIDLSPEMMARARARPRPENVSIDFKIGDVQSADLGDQAFDAAVATFVFCSVPDPVQGLRNLRQAVKPGGAVYLLEHVRIDRPVVGLAMDLFDPLAVRLSGAHINRRTVENVRAVGFREIHVEEHGPLGIVRLIEAAV